MSTLRPKPHVFDGLLYVSKYRGSRLLGISPESFARAARAAGIEIIKYLLILKVGAIGTAKAGAKTEDGTRARAR